MRLLTAPGLAGIAIVRVEPAERLAMLACLSTSSGAALTVRAGAPPMRCVLQLDREVVDDVLLVARDDEVLEVHLHGSPVVLEHLHRHFGLAVDKAASPAEGLLREALSVEQLQLALEQQGMDFEQGLAAVLADPPIRRAASFLAARERSRVALALANAQRVVLVGQQNAGKSSLFNRLLFRERALTGATPGLTRDPIAEVTVLDGYPYELVDTAGEGEDSSVVDAAAIKSGRALREHAIVVLVVDGAVGPGSADRELLTDSALVVCSKRDLPAASWPTDFDRHIEISTQLDDPVATRAGIGRLLTAHRALPAAGPVGGFAALCAEQWRRLIAAEGDCSAPPSLA